MYPTLLKLAGAPLEQKLPIDGKDAWATIAEGEPTPHDEILHNATPSNGAIRVGDWKLIINGEKADGDLSDRVLEGGEDAAAQRQVELFNIVDDPSEKNNLAAKHPEKVKELRETFQRAGGAGRAAEVEAKARRLQIAGGVGRSGVITTNCHPEVPRRIWVMARRCFGVPQHDNL